MKKAVLAIVLTFLLLFKAEAQVGELLGSVSGGYLLPIGEYANFIGQGLGFGLHGKHYLTDNFAAGVSLSSFALFINNTSTEYFNMDQIHLSSDYFFLTDEIRPYVGVEFGYTQYQSSSKLIDANRKTENISYGIGGGLMYFFNDNLGGNAFARYSSIDSKDNYLLLGLGLTYKFD